MKQCSHHPRCSRATNDHHEVTTFHGPRVPEMFERAHEPRARRGEPGQLVEEDHPLLCACRTQGVGEPCERVRPAGRTLVRPTHADEGTREARELFTQGSAVRPYELERDALAEHLADEEGLANPPPPVQAHEL